MSTSKSGNNHKYVILFPFDKWKFFDHYENDSNPIENWYQNDLSFAGQTQFNSLLKNCKKTDELSQWLGFKRFLTGAPKGVKVWELKFKADRREYRIMGMFTGISREVLLLIGCYHKQRNYTPSNAIETAFRRAKAQLDGRAAKHERQIADDL